MKVRTDQGQQFLVRFWSIVMFGFDTESNESSFRRFSPDFFVFEVDRMLRNVWRTFSFAVSSSTSSHIAPTAFRKQPPTRFIVSTISDASLRLCIFLELLYSGSLDSRIRFSRRFPGWSWNGLPLPNKTSPRDGMQIKWPSSDSSFLLVAIHSWCLFMFRLLPSVIGKILMGMPNVISAYVHSVCVPCWWDEKRRKW